MSAVVDTITGSSGRKAARAADQAVQEFEQLETPDIANMRLELEDLVLQGQLTPEQAEAAMIEANALDTIAANPDFEQAQIGALDRLQNITESDGLDAQALSRLNQIETEEANRERGSREAILQDRAQRGLGGSGSELMALLANQQGSAQRQSQRDMDVAAMAEQRALEAIMNQGNLAGNMREQDFNEQARIAEAQNRINEFNAANRQQTEMSNVEARNQAQAQNLAERQRVADQNVQQGNQAQQYNRELFQRDFENRMARAENKAGALGQKSKAYSDQQAANLGFTGGILQTGGNIVGGLKKKKDS